MEQRCCGAVSRLTRLRQRSCRLPPSRSPIVHRLLVPHYRRIEDRHRTNAPKLPTLPVQQARAVQWRNLAGQLPSVDDASRPSADLRPRGDRRRTNSLQSLQTRAMSFAPANHRHDRRGLILALRRRPVRLNADQDAITVSNRLMHQLSTPHALRRNATMPAATRARSRTAAVPILTGSVRVARRPRIPTDRLPGSCHPASAESQVHVLLASDRLLHMHRSPGYSRQQRLRDLGLIIVSRRMKTFSGSASSTGHRRR